MSCGWNSDDRGQALPVLVGVVASLVALLLAVARFAGGVSDAARARTAADAAALAGVTGGGAAAAALAAANGGRLVRFAHDGAKFVVVVAVGRAHAVAAASDGP